MSKKLLFSMLIAGLSQGAFAHEHEGRKCEGHMGPPPFERVAIFPGILNDRPEPKEGPCADLKLDKSQKAQIKEAYFKVKEDKIELESKLRKAFLNEEKLRSDDKSDFAAAEDASSAKIEAIAKLMQVDDTYRNTVFYKILKADQRGAAVACWKEEHHFGPMGPKGPEGFKHKFKKDDKKRRE